MINCRALGLALALGLTRLMEAQTVDLAERFAPVHAASGTESAAERLHLLFEIDWAIRLEESPELATYAGMPGHNDRWTDLSAAALARQRTHAPAALAALASINPDQLGPEDQLSYLLFRYETEEALALQAFPEELLPLSQLDGVHQSAAYLLEMAPRQTVADLEDQLRRLETLPTLVDQTIALLQQGIDRGITLPQVVLRDVPQQVRNQIVETPLDSPLLGAFRSPAPTLSAEDHQRLQTAAVRRYQENIVPAWRRLEQFLVSKYLPAARTEIGWAALPNGATWYEAYVRQRTTTALTPKEIHEIGLSEVARIRGEMERVKAATGFAGSMPEFFTFLRTDPQFYFTDQAELLRTYRDIAKRADAELPRLFGVLPRTPYGVVPVPSYAEQSQTTAYYQPGALAAGRAGLFFANTYALETRPKWEMEALTLHEAVPGHHLQIALQQELAGLPAFRRFGLDLTAYIEGWGLYAESLGEEMNFYTDPYAKFGQLTYEMWRAVRLVVDTGMHSQGWSRERAIAYFRENAGKSDNDIIVEVDRYIAWPGQALAYKLGELKLKQLRAEAQRTLGARFQVRAFHDQVLRHGPLPLHLLEEHTRAWIETQRGNRLGDTQN